MAISQTAIDKFLEAPIPYLPQFKGADPDWLRSTIYDVTGRPYKPKTEPRPHQLEGIAFALYQRQALLYYGMRLGKSLMSLQWAEQLRIAKIWTTKGIIICHAPIALDVWESEAEKHSNLILYPVRNQIDEFIDALESDADLIVVPWSGLQNIFTEIRETRKGKNKLYPNYQAVRTAAEAFSLGIVDEIHSAKNHLSLRFKLAQEILKHCQFKLGLTGTPFGRNVFDVWSQAFLVDQGKTLGYNYNFFEACFGNKRINRFSGNPEYIFNPKKQPLLEKKLSSLALAYKLEECQQLRILPGVVDLKIVGDQRNAYEACIDKIIKLSDKQDAEIKAVFLRLRQISSGFLPFVDAFGNELVHYFKTNVKIEWLREFLIEVRETKASVILFHEYTLTGKMLCEALADSDVTYVWLHGDTKDKPAAVRDFQAKRVQVIVVQSATGSLAIDLHAADIITFFESPVSPIIRAQAEARPLSQARGDRPLIIDDLTCSGVERKILQYIKSGKDLMVQIIHERKSLEDHGGTHGRVRTRPRVGRGG